jgi:membrane protein implicated in regulation of membrane protease activity
MIHRPRSVIGYVILIMIIIALMPMVVSLAGSLSSPWLWAAIAVVAVTSISYVLWRRRVEAARERAWVGSFSFGDVVARRRAEAAKQEHPELA